MPAEHSDCLSMQFMPNIHNYLPLQRKADFGRCSSTHVLAMLLMPVQMKRHNRQMWIIIVYTYFAHTYT